MFLPHPSLVNKRMDVISCCKLSFSTSLFINFLSLCFAHLYSFSFLFNFDNINCSPTKIGKLHIWIRDFKKYGSITPLCQLQKWKKRYKLHNYFFILKGVSVSTRRCVSSRQTRRETHQTKDALKSFLKLPYLSLSHN